MRVIPEFGAATRCGSSVKVVSVSATGYRRPGELVKLFV